MMPSRMTAAAPRAFNINDPPIPPTSYINHDTQAAGIAIAKGTGSNPNDGAAPEATLYSAAVTDLAATVKTLVATKQCRVIFAVIQDTSTNVNKGESFWSLLYDYYAYTDDVIFATAAGNGSASYEYYPYNTPPTPSRRFLQWDCNRRIDNNAING